ncbi:MAG: cupin domain-containing protein [Actinomycetota bacterium]
MCEQTDHTGGEERPPATATTLHDNTDLRVTRFDFAPGEETGWHTHAYDYVVTPVTDCHMLVESSDGTTQHASVRAGEAYHRVAGAHHNVVNDGQEPMSFVEVERK